MQHENPEQLVSTIVAGSPSRVPVQVVLRWANGVLFMLAPFQPSEVVAKEFLSGHLLWDHLDFAIMSDFQRAIRIAERPLLQIDIIDLSDHPIYGPFANWIKNNLVVKATRHQKTG
jgi:hypothetical protein